MSERHTCAMADCAAWGEQRFVGRIPGVSEHVEGWLCKSHAQPMIGDLSVGYRIDGQDWGAGVVFPRRGEVAPVQQPKRKPNRQERRAAERRARKAQ